MKKLLLITLLTQMLFSASIEQVEDYLSLSHAEEEIIEMESQFSQMQNSFSQKKQDDNKSSNKIYEMQMLSIRFKDYIQTHLSEDEMDSILANYKNVLFLQYTTAISSVGVSEDTNQTDRYMKRLEDEEYGKRRIELIDNLSKTLYNEENIAIIFDELMTPLIENSKGSKDLNKEYMQKSRDNYVKTTIQDMRDRLLLATKEFTIEELEELEKFSKNTAIDLEFKVISGATAYALKEFFLSMASRYDVSKH